MNFRVSEKVIEKLVSRYSILAMDVLMELLDGRSRRLQVDRWMDWLP